MENQEKIQIQINVDKRKINIPPLKISTDNEGLKAFIVPQGKSPRDHYKTSPKPNFFIMQPECSISKFSPSETKQQTDDELKQFTLIRGESPRILKLLETKKNKLSQLHVSSDVDSY